MFIEHISGDSAFAAEMRCSTVMVTAPPVVMFTTASVACLMRGKNCMNTEASDDGRPSLGSRACKCRIAAPALAASIAWGAIWSGVIGSASDIVGVWIEPVIAQLMMILLAMVRFSLLGCYRLCRKSFSRGGSFVKYDAAFKRKNREAEPRDDEPPDALRRREHD